jgi:hypothetical protein
VFFFFICSFFLFLSVNYLYFFFSCLLNKVYADGSKYVRDFHNDKRSGYRVLTDREGKVLYQGQWKDDCQVWWMAVNCLFVAGGCGLFVCTRMDK